MNNTIGHAPKTVRCWDPRCIDDEHDAGHPDDAIHVAWRGFVDNDKPRIEVDRPDYESQWKVFINLDDDMMDYAPADAKRLAADILTAAQVATSLNAIATAPVADHDRSISIDADTREQSGGLVNHWMRRTDILAGTVEGRAGRALCGVEFVPRARGNGSPASTGASTCSECDALYSRLEDA
jgi:hypothetical protein